MACETCGEKPKKCGNCNKDFPRAVIEINNPETLVLLRKVVIPASMGTEEQVPPAIGKYHNVILYYEANKHTYLYSSDGIPTLLETEIPQEIIDRIDTLEDNVEDLNDAIDDVEQEIEDLKNSPDVVDIVATYVDLQNYDTSSLGDKDVIRVLTDETHDNESSYYRWNTTTQTWTFIGATGPYYTKDEVDDLLDEKQGTLTAGNKISINNDTVSLVGDSITVLTADDFDYPINAPDGIAMWNREPGIYIGNVTKYLTATASTNHMVIIHSKSSSNPMRLVMSAVTTRETGGFGDWYRPKLFSVYAGSGSSSGIDSTLSNDGGYILTRNDVITTLNIPPRTIDRYYPISALAVSTEINNINKRILQPATSAPTTSTEGVVGSLLSTVESGTPHLYICTNVSQNPDSYTWTQIL